MNGYSEDWSEWPNIEGLCVLMTALTAPFSSVTDVRGAGSVEGVKGTIDYGVH